MKRSRSLLVGLMLAVFSAAAAHGTTVTWNLENMFGMSTNNDAKPCMDEAILAAKSYFTTNSNTELILKFGVGTYTFWGSGKGIDLKGINPGTGNRLIVSGCGRNNTRLRFDRNLAEIDGRTVSNVKFEGIEFSRIDYTVSQGTVVRVAPGEVVLDIHDGYPTPVDIYDPVMYPNSGRYLREYTDSLTYPQIKETGNDQIAWTYAEAIPEEGPRRYRMVLLYTKMLASNYVAGDIIGIKSKHGGQTYFFTNADNIEFSNVRWTRTSRGVLRGGSSNILFDNWQITRETIGGRSACLSTPDGGPQLNQPVDAASSNCVVRNGIAIGTGDDCTAFFAVASGSIVSNVFKDSFARGIVLTAECSTNVVLLDNTLVRAPLLDMRP